MRASVDLEIGHPEQVRKVLEPSLTSDKRVSYSFESDEESLTVEVETDGLGPLRGCTDTIFRLSSLATKIYDN